jgi:hypothetical protein
MQTLLHLTASLHRTLEHLTPNQAQLGTRIVVEFLDMQTRTDVSNDLL